MKVNKRQKGAAGLILAMVMLGMCVIVVSAYMITTGKSREGQKKVETSVKEEFDKTFERDSSESNDTK